MLLHYKLFPHNVSFFYISNQQMGKCVDLFNVSILLRRKLLLVVRI